MCGDYVPVEATLTPIEVFNEILKIVTPMKVQFDRERGG